MMKKKIIATVFLVLAIMVAACGKKEYTVSELYDAIMEAGTSAIHEMESMTDEELYGTSSNEEERQKHYDDVYQMLKAKYASDCDIKNGTVITTGVFREFIEHANMVFIDEFAEKSEYKNIYALTNDPSFKSLSEGETIRIKATYKDGTLINATLLNSTK